MSWRNSQPSLFDGRRVAIIGSRVFPRLDLVSEYVVKLEAGVTVVSGGALGVDTHGEKSAKERGLRTLIFLPDYDKYGAKAPLVRNATIVENSDEVVAFWDGESSGTHHAIRTAERMERPVRIITTRKVGVAWGPDTTITYCSEYEENSTLVG